MGSRLLRAHQITGIPSIHNFCLDFYRLKKLAPLSQPIRCETKTNYVLVTRAFGSLPVFTLSPAWHFRLFLFLWIGRCDYLGFGVTKLNLEVF